MKQVIYCADCGSKVDSEMGFCPKCDFEGDSGDVGIPPLADLWDMSMEQLGQLAESNSIRGWRRLEQKGLIYQLNQLRLVQAEESSIVSLQEEFLQLAQEKKVDEAKKKWAEIQESVEEIDEQLVLTMLGVIIHLTQVCFQWFSCKDSFSAHTFSNNDLSDMLLRNP